MNILKEAYASVLQGVSDHANKIKDAGWPAIVPVVGNTLLVAPTILGMPGPLTTKVAFAAAAVAGGLWVSNEVANGAGKDREAAVTNAQIKLPSYDRKGGPS